MAWSVKKKVIVISCTGFVLAVLGAVMIPVVNYVVKIEVQKNMLIKEDGMMYEIWRDLPIPIYLQFYVFHVANPDEVLDGKKPFVYQKGPYTYRERRTKFNITFNNNGTVTYKQNRTFNFVRDMSVGSESDVFTTPNPVFWTLAQSIKWQDPEIKKAISLINLIENEKAFMKRSMKEIIWGYHDQTLKIAKEIAPEWFYTDFIGYFINKNDTNDGVYTIFTGENDITRLGHIDKYNGSSYLNFWTTKWANQINGSDGTNGAPYTVTKSTKLYAFASDVCRSAEGAYSGDVTGPGDITLWRYAAEYSYMANATVNPDNIGFCTPQSSCLDTGMLNVSSCQLIDFFHIPAAFSFPHFYMASQKYKDSVEGLSPNKEEHQIALDVDPYTGWVFQAAKRLQVNMYMKHIDDIAATRNISPVFMPVFWFNESAVIDPPRIDMLKSKLFTPLLIIEIAEITLIAGGALIMLIGIAYGSYKRRQNPTVLKITQNGHREQDGDQHNLIDDDRREDNINDSTNN